MDYIIEKVKNIVTDSIKFWEIGRLIYNVILAFIVIGFFVAGITQGKKIDYLDISLGLFVLAIVANILYCIAYFIDIFVQLSAFYVKTLFLVKDCRLEVERLHVLSTTTSKCSISGGFLQIMLASIPFSRIKEINRS